MTNTTTKGNNLVLKQNQITINIIHHVRDYKTGISNRISIKSNQTKQVNLSINPMLSKIHISLGIHY